MGMKRSEIIPQSTFKVMKHFIGLDYEKPKRGVYTAYRNRWNRCCTGYSKNRNGRTGLCV